MLDLALGRNYWLVSLWFLDLLRFLSWMYGLGSNKAYCVIPSHTDVVCFSLSWFTMVLSSLALGVYFSFKSLIYSADLWIYNLLWILSALISPMFDARVILYETLQYFFTSVLISEYSFTPFWFLIGDLTSATSFSNIFYELSCNIYFSFLILGISDSWLIFLLRFLGAFFLTPFLDLPDSYSPRVYLSYLIWIFSWTFNFYSSCISAWQSRSGSMFSWTAVFNWDSSIPLTNSPLMIFASALEFSSPSCFPDLSRGEWSEISGGMTSVLLSC